KTVDGVYEDRTIDIDLLMYDDVEICDERLILPHPRMHERNFVMEPLEEILEDERKFTI
ncbi:MAG: 2-amino-4-hydroxy-6-hydroxymethyldihydropteridine diphosphokinase, partial [Bacteroidaceae bacterium]|nr:2-amino-4-hydroxy-6-hydroxymethyldihydropteridine diphosphokinase [Bacteroidaceae bacterium]